MQSDNACKQKKTMSDRGPNCTTERNVLSKNGGSPHVNVSWQLSEAGIEVGEKVDVVPKDGYVIVKPKGMSDREVAPEDRDNIPELPIESPFEAQVVGNRLWRQGGKHDNEHLKNETRHLARRFHAYADELRGEDNE